MSTPAQAALLQLLRTSTAIITMAPLTQLLTLWALTLQPALSHMQMSSPSPLRDPTSDRKEPKDYNILTPLARDGSDFTCKGYQWNTPLTPVATYEAGGTYTMRLKGGATHGGGSCQIALSCDNGIKFRVLKSIVGGCPLKKKYKFNIPEYVRSGRCILGWSWFNRIGNREMYMNCAVVDVIGKDGQDRKKKRPSESDDSDDDGNDGGVARLTTFNNAAAQKSLKRLPELYVANLENINSCYTHETVDPVFDDPGDDVEYGDDDIKEEAERIWKMVKRGEKQICTGVGKKGDGSPIVSMPGGSKSKFKTDGQWTSPGSNDGQWHGDKSGQKQGKPAGDDGQWHGNKNSQKQKEASKKTVNCNDGQYHPDECGHGPSRHQRQQATSDTYYEAQLPDSPAALYNPSLYENSDVAYEQSQGQAEEALQVEADAETEIEDEEQPQIQAEAKPQVPAKPQVQPARKPQIKAEPQPAGQNAQPAFQKARPATQNVALPLLQNDNTQPPFPQAKEEPAEEEWSIGDPVRADQEYNTKYLSPYNNLNPDRFLPDLDIGRRKQQDPAPATLDDPPTDPFDESDFVPGFQVVSDENGSYLVLEQPSTTITADLPLTTPIYDDQGKLLIDADFGDGFVMPATTGVPQPGTAPAGPPLGLVPGIQVISDETGSYLVIERPSSTISAKLPLETPIYDEQGNLLVDEGFGDELVIPATTGVPQPEETPSDEPPLLGPAVSTFRNESGEYVTVGLLNSTTITAKLPLEAPISDEQGNVVFDKGFGSETVIPAMMPGPVINPSGVADAPILTTGTPDVPAAGDGVNGGDANMADFTWPSSTEGTGSVEETGLASAVEDLDDGIDDVVEIPLITTGVVDLPSDEGQREVGIVEEDILVNIDPNFSPTIPVAPPSTERTEEPFPFSDPDTQEPDQPFPLAPVLSSLTQSTPTASGSVDTPTGDVAFPTITGVNEPPIPEITVVLETRIEQVAPGWTDTGFDDEEDGPDMWEFNPIPFLDEEEFDKDGDWITEVEDAFQADKITQPLAEASARPISDGIKIDFPSSNTNGKNKRDDIKQDRHKLLAHHAIPAAPSSTCTSIEWNCDGCTSPNRCVRVNRCMRTCTRLPYQKVSDVTSRVLNLEPKITPTAATLANGKAVVDVDGTEEAVEASADAATKRCSPEFVTGDTAAYLPCQPGTILCKSEAESYTCGQFGGVNAWSYGALRQVPAGMKCKPGLMKGFVTSGKMKRGVGGKVFGMKSKRQDEGDDDEYVTVVQEVVVDQDGNVIPGAGRIIGLEEGQEQDQWQGQDQQEAPPQEEQAPPEPEPEQQQQPPEQELEPEQRPQQPSEPEEPVPEQEEPEESEEDEPPSRPEPRPERPSSNGDDDDIGPNPDGILVLATKEDVSGEDGVADKDTLLAVFGGMPEDFDEYWPVEPVEKYLPADETTVHVEDGDGGGKLVGGGRKGKDRDRGRSGRGGHGRGGGQQFPPGFEQVQGKFGGQRGQPTVVAPASPVVPAAPIASSTTANSTKVKRDADPRCKGKGRVRKLVDKLMNYLFGEGPSISGELVDIQTWWASMRPMKKVGGKATKTKNLGQAIAANGSAAGLIVERGGKKQRACPAVPPGHYRADAYVSV